MRDLTPLGDALSRCELLVHGGERDLQLLAARAALTPARVVDTQVLAGVQGLGFPRRLGELEAEVLDLADADAHRGLSDWSRRPFSPEQLAYAAADVSTLHRLVDALMARATPAQRRWAEGATAELVERWLTPQDPTRMWRTLPAARVLGTRARERLSHLVAWRAQEGARQNMGPWNVASDRVLVDVARRAPRSVEALRENRLTPKGLVRRHGEVLVGLVASAPAGTLDPLPTTPAERALQALVQAWAHGTEAQTGVAAGLTMPAWRLDSLLSEHMRGASRKKLIGWLEEFSGNSLRNLMDGQIALRADARSGTREDA